MRHYAGVVPQDWVIPRVWCLLESSFGCITCVDGWIELWFGLKPTTGCVVSGSIWMWFRYMSLSVVCNWFWAICLELPHYSLFVSAFLGPVCVGNRTICVYELVSQNPELRSDQ